MTGADTVDGILPANGVARSTSASSSSGAQERHDLASEVTGHGVSIVVTGGAGLSITARMGAGGAPDRKVAMVHSFGGTRDDSSGVLAP